MFLIFIPEKHYAESCYNGIKDKQSRLAVKVDAKSIEQFEQKIQRLEAENLSLKELLKKHGLVNSPGSLVEQKKADAIPKAKETLSPAQKVKLYRSFFKGREDVFAIRWEHKKSGKPGYSPVCLNQWDKSICRKPIVKCSDCPHQNWKEVVISSFRRRTFLLAASLRPLGFGSASQPFFWLAHKCSVCY